MRRFADKTTHWYTDGSMSKDKSGATCLTAAVAKSLEDDSQNVLIDLPVENHDLRLHTSVRAEHVAIATAVADAPADKPITIFTDSLTSIYNIKGMLGIRKGTGTTSTS